MIEAYSTACVDADQNSFQRNETDPFDEAKGSA